MYYPKWPIVDRASSMQQARVRVLYAAFFIFFGTLDFSGKRTVKYITYCKDTGILLSIYWKSCARKNPVHLPFALLPYGIFAGIIL